MVKLVLIFRSTDFVVEEVDTEGRVTEYSPDCIYADPDLERKKAPVVKEEKEITETEPVTVEYSREKIKEELIALFDDADFAESVLALYEQKEAYGVTQVTQESRAIDDKDHRKRIHLYFKCHFEGRLVTDVVSPSNNFRVSLKKAGTGRPSSYDHRNNQGPNDPKPVPFLEFTLWKDGLDTMEAVQILSKRLLMPAKSFSYAGTKDRRSVSTQRIVVRNALPAKIAGVNKMTGMRMKVSHLRSVVGPLRFGDLSGNRFTIILRNCQYENVESVQKAVECLSQKGFINYYGLQRFGRGGGEFSTDAIGRALLSGKFQEACSMILDPRPDESNKQIAAARAVWKETGDPEKALEAFPFRCSAERAILQHFIKSGHRTDYPGAIACINRELRLMYVHAVQSLWWNAAASRRKQIYGNENCVVGDLVMNESTGQVEIVTEETLNSFTIFNVVLPIIGYSTTLYPLNELGEFIRSLPAEYPEICQKDKWKHLWDLPGGFRHFLQKPKNFELKFFNYSDADEILPPPITTAATEPSSASASSSDNLKAVQLRFTLPTSAYATMLLREIFPKETSTSGDYHKNIETS